jgi:hypothetical protein
MGACAVTQDEEPGGRLQFQPRHLPGWARYRFCNDTAGARTRYPTRAAARASALPAVTRASCAW